MNYSLLIGLPSVLFIFDQFIKTRHKYFEKIGIIFLIVFSALRVNVGFDYQTYERIFFEIKYGHDVGGFEKGYVFLNKTVAFFGGSFHSLLFVISLIYVSCIYFYISSTVADNKWLSLFLYLSYFNLYIYTLATVRQSVAVGIFLVATIYLVNQKPIKYIFLIFLATLFHWTAISLLLFYPVYSFLKNKKSSFVFFVCSVAIPIYLFSINNIESFLNLFSDKLNFYLVLDKSEVQNSLLIALVYYCAMAIWLLIVKIMNGNSKSLSVPNMAVTIFLLLKVMQSLHYFGALPRFELYFYCFIPFAIVELVNKIRSQYLRLFIIVILVIAFIVQFIYEIGVNSDYYGVFNIV